MKIQGGKRSHIKLKDLNTEKYMHLTKEQYELLTQGKNADKLHKHDFPTIGAAGGGGGGARTFLALDDVFPSSYSGQAGKIVAVNATETGLEFISAGSVTNYWDRINVSGAFYLIPKTVNDSVALGDTTHAGGSFYVIGDTSGHSAFTISSDNNYDVYIGDISLAIQPRLYCKGIVDIEGVLSLGLGPTRFFLPSADGTPNQVMKTDGAGNVTWQAEAGGVTKHEDLTDMPSATNTDHDARYGGSGWDETTTLKTAQDHIASASNPHSVTLDQAYDAEGGTRTVTVDNGNLEFNISGYQTIFHVTGQGDDFIVRLTKASGTNRRFTIDDTDGNLLFDVSRTSIIAYTRSVSWYPTDDNTYDLGGYLVPDNRYWRDLGLKRNLTDGTNSVTVAQIYNHIADGTIHFTMLDEDNMASDSDTQAATQQSIKAYVDALIAGEDLWDRTGTLLTPKTSGDDIATSGKIGIGFESAPTFALHIAGTDTNTSAGLIARYSDDSDGPLFVLIKSRGSISSPAAIQSGDNLGIYYFGGYDGSDVQASASIISRATENWSGSARGSNMVFSVIPGGTTSAIDALTLDDSGEARFINSIRLEDGKEIFGNTDANITIISGQASTGNDGTTLILSSTAAAPGGSNAGDVQVKVGGSDFVARWSQEYFGGWFGYHLIGWTKQDWYYDSDTFGVHYDLRRARGSYSSPTDLQSGDLIADFNFYGYAGGSFQHGAYIQAVVTATPGSADMPTALIFATSADGSASPTESYRIEAGGNILVSAANKIQFRDSAIYIHSKDDSFMDFVADGGYRFGAGGEHLAIGRGLAGGGAQPDVNYLVYIHDKGSHPQNFVGVKSFIMSTGSGIYSAMSYEATTVDSGTGSPTGVSGIAKARTTGVGANVSYVKGVLARAAIYTDNNVGNLMGLEARADLRMGGDVTNEAVAMKGMWVHGVVPGEEYTGTVTRGKTLYLEEPYAGPDGGVILTKWALQSDGDIQINSDKKLILEGTATTKGDTYIIYNSTSGHIEFYLNGVLEGYIDATGFVSV